MAVTPKTWIVQDTPGGPFSTWVDGTRFWSDDGKALRDLVDDALIHRRTEDAIHNSLAMLDSRPERRRFSTVVYVFSVIFLVVLAGLAIGMGAGQALIDWWFGY